MGRTRTKYPTTVPSLNSLKVLTTLGASMSRPYNYMTRWDRNSVTLFWQSRYKDNLRSTSCTRFRSHSSKTKFSISKKFTPQDQVWLTLARWEERLRRIIFNFIDLILILVLSHRSTGSRYKKVNPLTRSFPKNLGHQAMSPSQRTRSHFWEASILWCKSTLNQTSTSSCSSFSSAKMG